MRIIKIQGCKTCKEVLLFVMRNENGEDFIQMIAWHTTKDGPIIQSEQMDLTKSRKPYHLLKCIINDFSEYSANQFANGFEL